MQKTLEEKQKELDQKIRRLQAEKRKLANEGKRAARAQRDHALIVFGAHILTHFPKEVEAGLIAKSDDEIRAWADSLFRNTNS